VSRTAGAQFAMPRWQTAERINFTWITAIPLAAYVGFSAARAIAGLECSETTPPY
jgi:hypothetical protein